MTPDLYVCFAILIPLTFPHDGVHVATGLYTFDLSFRFTIQVNHGLVEHGVDGLLVVTHGSTVVHTANEYIFKVHLTPRPRVLVSNTGELFAVRNPSDRLVCIVSHTSVTIGWHPCNGLLFHVRNAKHVHTSTSNCTTAKRINSGVSQKRNFMQPDLNKATSAVQDS